ncbi:MAG: hypothetical protein CSA81_05100 [Acidobacteria bacterium]|nr:MAG: hypothetical protein CSA81_05100 [Acidobacteriota bacterium]
MSRRVQIFNPVHLQKVKSEKLTVMGRVQKGHSRQPISIYLNSFLIRKVTPSKNGAFECRLSLADLPYDEQQYVEIRMISGFGTERLKIPFYKCMAKENEEQN